MENLDQLLLALPVLLLSFTAHEFAHAWVALRQGDDTAYMLGRVTLDPRPHIDPIGSLLFPALAIMTGMPLLGWAKPVPTNPRKYRHFVRGDILVSLAGVCANFVLILLFTVLWGLVFWLASRGVGGDGEVMGQLARMLQVGVMLNVGLILFNLLPVPPLDGSHVFYHLLPAGAGASYRQLYAFGPVLLWILVLTGALRFLFPLIVGATEFFLGIPLRLIVA